MDGYPEDEANSKKTKKTNTGKGKKSNPKPKELRRLQDDMHPMRGQNVAYPAYTGDLTPLGQIGAGQRKASEDPHGALYKAEECTLDRIRTPNIHGETGCQRAQKAAAANGSGCQQSIRRPRQSRPRDGDGGTHEPTVDGNSPSGGSHERGGDSCGSGSTVNGTRSGRHNANTRLKS